MISETDQVKERLKKLEEEIAEEIGLEGLLLQTLLAHGLGVTRLHGYSSRCRLLILIKLLSSGCRRW